MGKSERGKKTDTDKKTYAAAAVMLKIHFILYVVDVFVIYTFCSKPVDWLYWRLASLDISVIKCSVRGS